jgi:hypothetical protein
LAIGILVGSTLSGGTTYESLLTLNSLEKLITGPSSAISFGCSFETYYYRTYFGLKRVDPYAGLYCVSSSSNAMISTLK